MATAAAALQQAVQVTPALLGRAVGGERGPPGYVTGEESAVVNTLSGGPSIPTYTPPRIFERGLGGRPTLMQNPETLCQVALVARYGPHWYRELGTEVDPGSVLVTISGAVVAPGVYEMAFGTSMTDLLGAAGGPSLRPAIARLCPSSRIATLQTAASSRKSSTSLVNMVIAALRPPAYISPAAHRKMNKFSRGI